MIIATEQTGTTTATAIVPPVESFDPPLAPESAADAVAVDPLVVAVTPSAELPVVVGSGESVDVIVRVCGAVVPSVGVWVSMVVVIGVV